MKKIAAVVLIGLCRMAAGAQPGYPDKGMPSDTPKIFAAGIISTGLSTRDFAISPSGDEILFTIQHPKFIASTIIIIKRTGGKWGKPAVAAFSGVYRDLEPCFSADGNTLYFSSDRPLAKNKPKSDFDIWKVSKQNNGEWGQPENLGNIVNSDKNEFYPSVAKNGNLYFTVEAPYGKGSEDIVMCKKTGTGYTQPVSLPEGINTRYDEFNAFIDQDEQFIIFSCQGRPDDIGKGDLYISHKNTDGSWQPAHHLPKPINSSFLDYCPFVSYDKKFFFFTSNRLRKEWYGEDPVTYDQLKSLLTEPGNGYDSVYWIKFDSDW
ncbi:MAG TPA: hypothetical protein VHE59_11140 [Mucilaginibacter sp.]|nr:hypothetical protein [Mucilaginibacter sp.]